MSKDRATWSYYYEKGLVDTLKDLANIPMFKAQNGWSPEGWRTITQKFNEKFPLAHFTKQQVQEKEELKRNYKMIRDAKKDSGAGWDESLCMLIAEPELWKKMIADNSRISKFKKKPFPLFNELASLHDGNLATGDLNFTSTGPPANQIMEPFANQIMEPPNKQITLERTSSAQSTHNMVGTSPFGHTEGVEAESAPSNLSTENQENQGTSGRKRKQSQIASQLANYMEFKKNQVEKTMEKLDDKKRREDDFSVDKCIDLVDSMEELTEEEKADANELWQSDMNRQIFMKTKNLKVRLFWLKKKISKMS